MKTEAHAFKPLLEVLDLVEIPYLVGGCMASSVRGLPRSTMDVDLVVDLGKDQVEDFSAKLKADFYADPEMMREALAHRRSFNLIHYASSFKFSCSMACH